MRIRKRISIQLLLILAISLAAGLPGAFAQDEPTATPRLDISSANAQQFPLIRVRVISTDGTSTRQPLPGELQISEDGNLVEVSETGSEVVGVDLIFVIDANGSIDSRDDSTRLTRREKVRDSIVRFANDFMNKSQMDKVSIVIPDGDQARFLLEDAIFPNEVINEINFYDPPDTGDTPLNEMLVRAIDKAASLADEGRFQAVLLFSDAGRIDDQLDYDSLVAMAQENNVPVFGAILGAAADNNEIANMERLVQPTRGTLIHMPQAEATDGIYGAIATNGEQFVVEYLSGIASSGSHEILIESGGVQDAVVLELVVQPPAVEMAIDNSAPIIRAVDAFDAPLTEAMPSNQPAAARVLWPDGYPRTIVEAAFEVDGSQEAVIQEPEIGDDGLIAFDWDISELGDGTYNLVIRVTDELGLEGATEPFPVSIAVDMPPPPSEVEEEIQQPIEEPTVPEEEGSSSGFLNNLGAVGIIIGLLAMMFAIGLVVFAIVLVRRRQTAAPAAAAPHTASASDDHDATQVIMPAFAAQKIAEAFLEPLENAGDHRGNIPLTGNNVAIGRDPKLVQIVFKDKSVSRLHARIIKKGGSYQLYDEGSASGTYLNYEQLSLEPQTLRENDDVHIGRVHLRFRGVQEVGEDDATQVMQASPARYPGSPQPAGAGAPIEDDTSTQPYMPQGPGEQGQQQSPPPIDDEDADDISTQPYMPHSPKR